MLVYRTGLKGEGKKAHVFGVSHFFGFFPLGRFSIVHSKSEGNMGCRVVSVAERTVVGLSVGFALRVWRWAGGLA